MTKDPIASNISVDLLRGLSNPHSLYNQWREKHPVFKFSGEPMNWWAVCRYEDVVFALKHPDLFSSNAIKSLFQHEWLDKKDHKDLGFTVQDPPDHTKNRQVVSEEFSKYRIAELENIIRETVQPFLAKLSPQKEIEFLDEFAYPYFANITDQMLGTENSMGLEELRLQPSVCEKGMVSNPSPEVMEEIKVGIQKNDCYIQSFINKRLENPSNDIISKLLAAKIDGEKLTDDKISNTIQLFLTAAAIGPIHGLSHCIIQLSRRPEIFKLLKEDLDLIPKFIEESLRFASGSTTAIRETREDVTLSGVTIPKGENVLLFLASANRDPSIFTDPDEFDMFRDNIHKHIAFGHGPHICIGNHLTRSTFHVVLEGIIRKFDGVSCPPDEELKWNTSWLIHSVDKLPVRFY